MQIIRTIIWVLLVGALVVFSWVNWDPTVTVRIWPGLLLDTKIPLIVVASFLIGFVPMWLYFRGVKWQLGRRIQSLERSLPTAAPAVETPLAEPELNNIDPAVQVSPT